MSRREIWSPEQAALCARVGTNPFDAYLERSVGVALNVRSSLIPLNGLRHPPESGTSGWFIWAGEHLSQDEDFFVPSHGFHLREWRPEVVPYLDLPPGYRFLVAPDYEDIWFDESLFDV